MQSLKTVMGSIFKKPTVNVVALHDLKDAEHFLLKEQAAAEYHAKMTEYYSGVVTRLSAFTRGV